VSTTGPRRVRLTETHAVYDDVLAPADFVKLWDALQVQRFQRVDALGLFGHWALDDAATLRGPCVGVGHRYDAEHPTGTPIDRLIEAILALAPELEPLLGARGTGWQVLGASMAIQPPGTGMTWHRDAPHYAGSYVFYAHPRWNSEWGGELLVSDDRSIPEEHGIYFHRLSSDDAGTPGPAAPAHLDNDDASALLMELGLGAFVAPRPNRLVVLRGGAPHAVAKVRAGAARGGRCSVNGFFVRPGFA
jgi:hypothetical protein